MSIRLQQLLLKHQSYFHPVIQLNEEDSLLQLDFTAANTALTPDLVQHTPHFSWYLQKQLDSHQCRFGIGGYNEDRVLYNRSEHFNGKEKRSIHLGIDTWGPAGTPVYAPMGAVIHSFAYNNHFGDYGATIILQHQLEGIVFYTLYGHLQLADLQQLQPGKYIARGELLAHFGEPAENGDWPPHLHFQVIEDMEGMEGDYPGVCTLTHRERYLNNCPDPDLILQMMNRVKA